MSAFYTWLRDSIIELSVAGWLPSIFFYEFVINAVLCALVIGPLLGCVGTMIVAKRMAFFSQAIGNAALTGVAIGVLIGESYTAPYVSMFSFCLAFGILLNYTKTRTKMSSDALIGVFLSISLAIGASLVLYVSARVNTHILES
ncbi:MAG: metal ABC transporter permease, partial [Gammaproteobacteria bacterium]